MRRCSLLCCAALVGLGCSPPPSPSFFLHDNQLAALRTAVAASTTGCESVRLQVPLPFDEVWPASLVVLSQAAIIASSHRSGASGEAAFLVIDSVSGAHHFKSMVDMPFSLTAREGESGVTALAICPLAAVLEPRYKSEQLTAIKEEMTRQSSWLLNRIMIQALAPRKWPWLHRGGSDAPRSR